MKDDYFDEFNILHFKSMCLYTVLIHSVRNSKSIVIRIIDIKVVGCPEF